MISEVVQWVSKTKSLCFETSFHTWKIACMRESVRTGHDIDIHIEICIFYVNDFVDYAIACALRWGVAFVGDFLYCA